MGAYPLSLSRVSERGDQELLLAIGTANQSRISEMEQVLFEKPGLGKEPNFRLLAIEEKLATYKTPISEQAATSEDYLRGRFAHRIHPGSPAHIETSKKATLSEKFLELKERWGQETAFISSPRDLFLHSAYQQIIGLGPQAVPLILAELRDEPGLWLWALHAMTGANPIPDNFDGGTQKIAELWLEWGRKNDYDV